MTLAEALFWIAIGLLGYGLYLAWHDIREDDARAEHVESTRRCCPDCGFVFDTPAELAQHRANVAPKPSKPDRKPRDDPCP